MNNTSSDQLYHYTTAAFEVSISHQFDDAQPCSSGVKVMATVIREIIQLNEDQ